MIFVFNCIVLLTVLKCMAYIRSANFQIILDSYLTLQNITTTSIISSKQECTLQCLQKIDRCSALSYDATSFSCKLGSGIISTPTARSETVHLMSVTSIQPPPCSQTPGFQIYQTGKLTACAWVCEDDPMNYTEATTDCMARGAHLYILKDTDKKKMPLRNTSVYWIGLDDMVTENVFLWADDGSVINLTLRSKLFLSGEPNDIGGQDCVFIYGDSLKLNDFQCEFAAPYICEISDFS